MAVRTDTLAVAGDLSINTARIKVDMSDIIDHLEPDSAVLTVITGDMPKRTSTQYKFDWQEDVKLGRTTAASATASTTATTITVDDGELVQDSALLLNTNSGEYFRVGASGGGQDALTGITRGVGSTAALVAVGDEIKIISTAYSDNDVSGSPVASQVTTPYNYTQNIRESVSVSGRLMDTDLYGGNELEYLHVTRGIDHAISKEQTFLFGVRNLATPSSAQPITYAGGMDEFITTNRHNLPGTIPSLVTVFDKAEADFRYGSKKKLMICSRSVASNIQLLAQDSLRWMNGSEDTFGLKFGNLETFHGTYTIVVSDLLDGSSWAKRAFVIDLEAVQYVAHQNRDTHLRLNIQERDRDGRKDEFLSDVGMVRRHEQKHAVWLNASSG